VVVVEEEEEEEEEKDDFIFNKVRYYSCDWFRTIQ
jgi:hypothetical protein